MIDLKQTCQKLGFKVDENKDRYVIKDTKEHLLLNAERDGFDNTVAVAFKAPFSIDTTYRAFDLLERQKQIDLFQALILYASQMDEENKDRDYYHTLKI